MVWGRTQLCMQPSVILHGLWNFRCAKGVHRAVTNRPNLANVPLANLGITHQQWQKQNRGSVSPVGLGDSTRKQSRNPVNLACQGNTKARWDKCSAPNVTKVNTSRNMVKQIAKIARLVFTWKTRVRPQHVNPAVQENTGKARRRTANRARWVNSQQTLPMQSLAAANRACQEENTYHYHKHVTAVVRDNIKINTNKRLAKNASPANSKIKVRNLVAKRVIMDSIKHRHKRHPVSSAQLESSMRKKVRLTIAKIVGRESTQPQKVTDIVRTVPQDSTRETQVLEVVLGVTMVVIKTNRVNNLASYAPPVCEPHTGRVNRVKNVPLETQCLAMELLGVIIVLQVK